MDPMLQVRNLTLDFCHDGKAYPVLNQLNFDIREAEMVGIVGESGCGKSLTALAIMGLLPPRAVISQGSIVFAGTDLTQLNELERCAVRGRHISMIFQEPMTALNPLMTIGSQIEEALLTHCRQNRREAYEQVIRMMKKVGLSRVEELYREYPHQLSGGMRQRAMIAIALVNRPALLIADEPTTALDVTIQAQILDQIKQLNSEYKTSVMLISHNLGVVSQLCSRVMILYSGHIVEEGPADDVFAQPLHPYTKGLIAAIPAAQMKGTDLYTIRGSVPSLYNRSGNGCCFAPRCDEAAARCFVAVPSVTEVGWQKVMCHLLAGKEGAVYEGTAIVS